MIHIDNEKGQYEMSGKTEDIIKEIVFAILQLAGRHAEKSGLTWDKSLDFTLKGITGISRASLSRFLKDWGKDNFQQ